MLSISVEIATWLSRLLNLFCLIAYSTPEKQCILNLWSKYKIFFTFPEIIKFCFRFKTKNGGILCENSDY